MTHFSLTQLRTLAGILLLILIAMPLWATSVSSQEPEEEAPVGSPEEETLTALSAPSATIFSYQGQLLDGNGEPISNAAMPMTFKLYTTATGGTACWTENHTAGNAINVSDGLFHVLLGQLTAINSACLANDAYLELIVNSETLSPRELLTSVAHAVEASSLADGDLAVVGDISSTGEIYEEHKSVIYSDNDARWFRFAESPASGIRNSGVFEIRWGRAGQHGHVRFAVGADFGQDAGIGITILDSSAHDGGLSGLGKIRLLMNDTYEQMYLEAYSEGGGSTATSITFHVYKYSGWGWSLIDITDGEIPTDYESYEMPADVVFGARSDENDIFVLNRDGNVGIGTASPGKPLEIASSNDGILRLRQTDSPTSKWNYIEWYDSTSRQFWTGVDLAGNFQLAPHSGDGLVLDTDGNVGIGTTSPSEKLHVAGNAFVGGNLVVDGPDLIMHHSARGDGGRALVHEVNDTLRINYAGDFAGGVKVGSNLHVDGNLSVGGSCSLSPISSLSEHEATVQAYNETDQACEAGSITSGAYIEANLQTAEERRAGGNEKFEEGDLLCWSKGKLKLCDKPNDPLVQGVANAKGNPIVLGAERIKVIGPVQEGDYLVASDVPGYAMATDNPTFGIVIAQALEDFEGERGLIKAMIRKM